MLSPVSRIEQSRLSPGNPGEGANSPPRSRGSTRRSRGKGANSPPRSRGSTRRSRGRGSAGWPSRRAAYPVGALCVLSIHSRTHDAKQLAQVALGHSQQSRRRFVSESTQCLTRLASLRREVDQLHAPVVTRRAPLNVSTLLQVVDDTCHP